MSDPERIRSLEVGDGGTTFVWYGDSCSGIPGGSNEQNFAAVNGVFQRLDRMPDAAIFAGDAIAGYTDDADELRQQWRYWTDREMGWFEALGIPLFQIPSNHNTTSATGEAVYREMHSAIPLNGPGDQLGLSYWNRHGDVLLVFVNTNFSGLGGSGHVEHQRLDQVLTEHADAPIKLVIGHHPIFGVNGYDLYPFWRVDPADGVPFWDVLVRHGVRAYLCSHILAFEVQVHDGVLQICTGGAGTYGMRLGLMPEPFEYFHLVQAAIDDTELRYQVLDTQGVAREWLVWPDSALEHPDLARFDPSFPPALPIEASAASSDIWILQLRIAGTARPAETDQTIVTGWEIHDGPETIWIGLAGPDNRLTVQLVPQAGFGAQRWDGPSISGDAPFVIELAIHSGMGPGGVLWRVPGGRWSSLKSSTAQGAAQLHWPDAWALAHGQSGPGDRPFASSDLRVETSLATRSLADLFQSLAVEETP